VNELERGAAWLRQAWWSALLAPPLRRSAAAATTLLAAAAIAAIGVLGHGIGDDLAICYVIPPLAATVLVDRNVGLALSGQAAVVWAVASSSTTLPGDLLALDAGLRFLVVSLAVCLVSGLRTAVERARRSDERSREFLALAAHQLRTPLAGMRASAEALAALPAERPDEHLLANLVREADRAGRLVTTLLDLSRLDLQEPIRTAPSDLTPVCREVVRQAGESSLQVAVRLSPGPAPAFADTNADVVRHILANLLQNAVRHARCAVELSWQRRGGQLELQVVDDGPGIPSGCEAIVFEPFVSLDGAGGSGLGLPLSRGLARKLGGDLRYEQRAFVLSLPAPSPLPSRAAARRLALPRLVARD
jgi:signal transduction histidine kinase